ncbi:vacuolar protein sorting-associated protein 54-like protein [Aphelenchoides avenae]|nr:vacuolar protein sorting-associated protein 54-like protein [Aphelenchus avenae]
MDSDGNTVDDLPNVCRLSLTPNRGEYPKSCALCPSVLLCTDADLVTHLRIEHCSKEGGSFVCRFGGNGVCQSLPLEGVSDEDYEQHKI